MFPTIFNDFDNFEKLFNIQFPTSAERFPLSDIGLDEEGNYVAEIAVAGFAKEDITIQVDGRNVIIKGTNTRKSQIKKYAQQVISTNSFQRTFSIPDNFDVYRSEAKLENGILTLKFFPSEEKQLKQITIQ